MDETEIFEALADQIEPLERAFSGLQRTESVSRINVAAARERRSAMRATATADSFYDSVFVEATEESALPELTRSNSVVLDAEEHLMDQKQKLAADIDEMKRTAAVLRTRIVSMEKHISESKSHPPTIYELLQKIAAAQQQTSGTIAWMSDQMLGAHRATQFLVKENALLRSRQAERQDLAREMQTQRRCGLAGSVEALNTQVAHIVQQQAAIIDALSAFSHSFDMPPPVAFSRRDATDESTYDEIINLMRQGMNDADPPPYTEVSAKTETAD